jgi:hypothetical protein
LAIEPLARYCIKLRAAQYLEAFTRHPAMDSTFCVCLAFKARARSLLLIFVKMSNNQSRQAIGTQTAAPPAGDKLAKDRDVEKRWHLGYASNRFA